jgi:hypothetical protein
MVIEKETSRMSPLSLREALEIVKTQKLDLILSEPQHMAIFDKTAAISNNQSALLLSRHAPPFGAWHHET